MAAWSLRAWARVGRNEFSWKNEITVRIKHRRQGPQHHSRTHSPGRSLNRSIRGRSIYPRIVLLPSNIFLIVRLYCWLLFSLTSISHLSLYQNIQSNPLDPRLRWSDWFVGNRFPFWPTPIANNIVLVCVHPPFDTLEIRFTRVVRQSCHDSSENRSQLHR